MPVHTTSAPAPHSHNGAPTLPHSVQDYLDNGAPEGKRNATLFGAAAQLRDIGMLEAAAAETLTSRAIADGLPPDEVKTTIAHAYRVAPRPAPQSDGTQAPRPRASKLDRVRHTPTLRPGHLSEKPASFAECQATPLPEPMEDGFKALLMAAFKEGEGVCIADTNEPTEGRRVPTRGVTLTREEWLQRIERKRGSIDKIFSTKHGLYLRVNPMNKEGRGEDADVTAFRHVLVEFDRDGNGKDVPKDLQFGAILNAGLPITAVLDSGNKSVHAWVRVDAKNAQEYAERVEYVFSLFDAAALDAQNKNPSRYSRCPDGWRHNEAGEIAQQRLLALNLGAESWEKFEHVRDLEEVETMTTDDLDAYDVSNDPNALLGVNRWLCKGGSVIWVSQSGVGKSSLLMNLAIGWALNRPEITFHIAPKRPLKSLIIQAENDKGDMAEAYQGVRDAHSLTDEEKRALKERIVFCRITTLSGAAFCKKMEKLVRLHKPDIVWIDPLLNFIGADVSDVEVVAEFCTGWLNEISRATDVIFSIMHHTGKPPKETRAGQTGSDAAYAGLGSSALTNWAREIMSLRRVLTADESDPPTFELEACKRRKRAGMRDTETGEVSPIIYVRHASDGRMAWEQCDKPEPPAKKGKRGKAGGDSVVQPTAYRLARGGSVRKMDASTPDATDSATTPANAPEAAPAAPLEPKKAGAPSVLTREIQAEIERMRLEGKSGRDIAKALGIGKTSVYDHIRNSTGEDIRNNAAEQ